MMTLSSSTRFQVRIPSLATSFALLMTLAFSGVVAQPASAAPTLQSVSLRGLRIGETTRLVFTGSELNQAPRVIVDGHAPPQKILKAAANRLELEVTLPESTIGGVKQLRLATKTGVSNALAVGVDDLPQSMFAAETQMPVAMTGSLTGGAILATSFDAKKGQRIVAELESRRLGANSRIVLRVLDARGVQLAFDNRNPSLGGDARCVLTAPADGRYTIEMHDVLYKGPGPGHFRLKLGSFKTIDFPLPLAIPAGEKTLVGFIAAEPTLPVDATSAIVGQSLPVAMAPWHSTAAVRVSSSKEVIEWKQSGGPQPLTAAPIGVTGLLTADEQEDRYLLPVKAGQRLRVDVIARRLGSRLDGVLTIRGEKGNQLARNDDQSNTSDPRLDYTVPKNIDKLLLCVSDIRGRGGEGCIYRVAVQLLGRPDFSLAMANDRLNIPAGGVQVLRVEATRAGHNGDIELSIPALPPELKISGERIHQGSNFTLLTLLNDGAAEFAGELTVVGRAAGVEPPVQRVARLKTPPAYASTQPWLAQSLAIGVAPADPIRIRWADDPNAPLQTYLGGDRPIMLQIERNDGVQGDVRFKLLADQVIPKKKVKQNNKEVTIDDLDRALRLAADARATAETSEMQVALLTPPDLADRTWTVVVQAELLSPKTKKPIATAYTTARTLRRSHPISLEAAAKQSIQARAGEGETGTLLGAVKRADGFDKPITITLQGLPKGYPAPEVVVPAGETEFKLPVRFDAKAKPAELKNVQLIGLYRPNPKNAALAVKTKPVAVSIQVVAPAPAKKPAEKKPSDEKAPPKDADKKDADEKG